MGLLKFDEVQRQVKRWLAAAKDKYGYNLFVKWAAKTFHRYDRRIFLQTELIKKLNAQISARDEQIEKMERFLNEKEGEINKLRKKAGAGEEDKQQEQSTSKDPEKKKKMNKGKRISQVTREKRKKAKMVEAEGRN